jgi:hypothetical protein
MMSLFPQREVINQKDLDERTRYHIPMIDGGATDSKKKNQ